MRRWRWRRRGTPGKPQKGNEDIDSPGDFHVAAHSSRGGGSCQTKSATLDVLRWYISVRQESCLENVVSVGCVCKRKNRFMKRIALFLVNGILILAVAEAGPTVATKDKPWVNSLGMKFVPVKGTAVLFSIWDTRVQDFEAFVKATGHDAMRAMYSVREDGDRQHGDTWKSPGFIQGPTHPVCGVSWKDAKAFCKWLTEKDHAEGRLAAGQEYRLPTDTEWSVAVGLGPEIGNTPAQKSGKIKDVYPWGTQWPPPHGAGNYAGEESKQGVPPNWKAIAGYNDSYPRTSPVGSFDANQFGLYDMGGNLWQWCEDLYQPDKELRVLRGASWELIIPRYMLSSCRDCDGPSSRSSSYGFRCVVVVGSFPSR